MFRQRILTVEKRLVSEAWTSFKRFEWRYDIPATDEGQPIFVSDDAASSTRAELRPNPRDAGISEHAQREYH